MFLVSSTAGLPFSLRTLPRSRGVRPEVVHVGGPPRLDTVIGVNGTPFRHKPRTHEQIT